MKRTHVEQRLDGRAAPGAAERGFALLRDRGALASLIQTLTATRTDLDGAQRLAFALGAGAGAAHLIVSREGAGVTCLGAGMTFVAPLVSWPVVELFLKQQNARWQAERAMQSVQHVDDDVSPLVRVVQHPHRLQRREWETLRALLPILGVQIFTRSVLVAIDKVVTVAAEQRHPPSAAAAQEMWRLYVAGAVGITLVGDQRGVTLMLLTAVLSGDFILAARALWFLANQPEETLACAAEVADKVPEHDDVAAGFIRLALAVVLPAVGFRCPGYFKEAERIRARLIGGDLSVTEARSRREVELSTVCAAPLLLPALCIDPQAVLLDVHVGVRAAAAVDFDAMAAAASSWHADVFRLWRPFADAQRAPRLVARPVGRATDDDDASVTLWRSLLRHGGHGLLSTPWLAKLVTLAPIEALLPIDEPDALWRLSDGAEYLRLKLPLLLGARGNTQSKSEPARAPPKPEPNAPCPCGSGRKWKKCHGAAPKG